MSLLPDPGRLNQLAGHLDGHAEHLRHQAGVLAAAAEQVHWHSTAATAFRARAAGVVVDLRNGAAGIAAVAASLRRHADAVRHHESVMQRIAATMWPPLAVVEALQ